MYNLHTQSRLGIPLNWLCITFLRASIFYIFWRHHSALYFFEGITLLYIYWRYHLVSIILKKSLCFTFFWWHHNSLHFLHSNSSLPQPVFLVDLLGQGEYAEKEEYLNTKADEHEDEIRNQEGAGLDAACDEDRHSNDLADDCHGEVGV